MSILYSSPELSLFCLWLGCLLCLLVWSLYSRCCRLSGVRVLVGGRCCSFLFVVSFLYWLVGSLLGGLQRFASVVGWSWSVVSGCFAGSLCVMIYLWCSLSGSIVLVLRWCSWWGSGSSRWWCAAVWSPSGWFPPWCCPWSGGGHSFFWMGVLSIGVFFAFWLVCVHVCVVFHSCVCEGCLVWNSVRFFFVFCFFVSWVVYVLSLLCIPVGCGFTVFVWGFVVCCVVGFCSCLQVLCCPVAHVLVCEVWCLVCGPCILVVFVPFVFLTCVVSNLVAGFRMSMGWGVFLESIHFWCIHSQLEMLICLGGLLDGGTCSGLPLSFFQSCGTGIWWFVSPGGSVCCCQWGLVLFSLWAILLVSPRFPGFWWWMAFLGFYSCYFYLGAVLDAENISPFSDDSSCPDLFCVENIWYERDWCFCFRGLSLWILVDVSVLFDDFWAEDNADVVCYMNFVVCYHVSVWLEGFHADCCVFQPACSCIWWLLCCRSLCLYLGSSMMGWFGGWCSGYYSCRWP